MKCGAEAYRLFNEARTLHAEALSFSGHARAIPRRRLGELHVIFHASAELVTERIGWRLRRGKDWLDLPDSGFLTGCEAFDGDHCDVVGLAKAFRGLHNGGSGTGGNLLPALEPE